MAELATPTRYAAFPDHPLHAVPQAILDAARAAVGEAAECNDVDPSMVDPIADSVVISLLPWLITVVADTADDGGA